jgi:hypothetical protein
MMMKDCQAHEKKWRNFCVDQNLEEHWLQTLNELNAFNLISICEGHYGERKNPSRKYAHINLKLKEKLLPGFVKDWETLRPQVLNEVHRLFQIGDTYFNLELRFKLRAGRGRLVYQEELTLKMRRFQPREAVQMDPESQAWFEQSITSIQALDQIILDWHQTKMEL